MQIAKQLLFKQSDDLIPLNCTYSNIKSRSVDGAVLQIAFSLIN